MRLALLLLLALPGAAAQIAIVDTGIDSAHAEFDDVSRVTFVTAIPIEDPDGHGTAVASIAAGRTLGTAPGAALVDLQVSGVATQGIVDRATEEAAIQALDWLLRNPEIRIAVLGFAEGTISQQGAATMAAQAKALFEQGTAVLVPPGDSRLHASPHVLVVGCLEGCPSGSVDRDGSAREVAAPSTLLDRDTRTTMTGAALAAADVAGTLHQMFQEREDLPVDAAFALLRGPHDPVDGAATWTDPLEPDRPAPTPLLGLALLLAFAVRRTWT